MYGWYIKPDQFLLKWYLESILPVPDGEIIKRIKSLRKQLSKELGLIIPLIHIKDNLELNPGEYRILIKDVEIAKAQIEPGKVLAIDTGSTKGAIGGKETKEPTFGLKAYWIEEKLKDKAKIMGYTVVDIPTVIITHISETIKNHSFEILGRSETKELVESLAKKYPIVKEIVPEQVSYSILHRVLQNLLREKIPIKDLLSIIESLSDNINKTADPDILTELVRQALSRLIVSLYVKNGKLYAVTLGVKLENYIMEKIKEYEGTIAPLDPIVMQQIIRQLTSYTEQFVVNQTTPVLLTSANVRRYVKKILEPYLANVVVLSYSEIEPKTKLNILGKVEIDEDQ